MKCIPYQNICFGFNSQYYYHLVTFVYVWHPRFELISFASTISFNYLLLYKLKFWILSLSSILFTHVTLFSFLLYTSTARLRVVKDCCNTGLISFRCFTRQQAVVGLCLILYYDNWLL